MSADELQKLHMKYIEKHLIAILMKFFKDEVFTYSETESATGLDGFMSAIYILRLHTKLISGEEKTRRMFIKFMKGDHTFRRATKSYIQFANESHVYSEVLPSFQKFICDQNVKKFGVYSWTAKAYVSKFGYIEDQKEALLVVEDLKEQGYQMGPRLFLKYEQIIALTKALAQYHAVSFSMKFTAPQEFQRIKNGITQLPFIYDEHSDDEKDNLYRVLYRVAFDRFFAFFETEIIGKARKKNEAISSELYESVNRLRQKYFPEPTRLLEKIRTAGENSDEDRLFEAILHGDYNRNNVLFRCTNVEETEYVIKMIDFQEIRYATIAIDLSFFMYCNMSKELREKSWNSVLKIYHDTLIASMSQLLQKSCSGSQLKDILHKYNFDLFMRHFSRYAFYGVLVCMHFLPWLLCSEDECSRLSLLFENDLHGEEFHQLSITAGGHSVDYQILDILRHGHERGYMDYILE